MCHEAEAPIHCARGGVLGRAVGTRSWGAYPALVEPAVLHVGAPPGARRWNQVAQRVRTLDEAAGVSCSCWKSASYHGLLRTRVGGPAAVTAGEATPVWYRSVKLRKRSGLRKRTEMITPSGRPRHLVRK